MRILKGWSLTKMAICLVIVFALGVILLLFVDYFSEKYFDFINGNRQVVSHQQIEKILGSFKRVPVEALQKVEMNKFGLLDPKFARNINGKYLYEIRKRDMYQKIVGDFRIKDFYSRDLGYDFVWFGSNEKLYWLMDSRVLHKLLDLQLALKEKGYDQNGFTVVFGHRSPLMNKMVGGASRSRHVTGEAIDLDINDIDKDGHVTFKDKSIVLDICERTVIGKSGGIGRYPHTQAVHIDVRGYYARWDSY